MDEVLARPTASVARLLRHQAALAAFGSFAFRETNLQKTLTEAARICAGSLNVPFCKVCRYRANEDDLLVVAGCGWQPNVIGHVISRADESTPQGRAYVTSGPVVIRNIQESNDLVLPAFYAQHGIISTIDVVIKGLDGPAYGVLEVDSPVETTYDENDINFLTGFANVLAEAVATQTRVETLKLFARELQHRVRNNFQHILSMMDSYSATLGEAESKKGIESISLRLMTMAQMYDHLLGAGIGRTVDFGSYLTALCASLTALQGTRKRNVELACAVDTAQVDLDTVATLGLAVAELVTNAYGHAFPDGRSGTITVARSRSAGEATLMIKDDGVGFDIDAANKRRGLGLVMRLVETVHGTITLASDNGTAWTITFQALAEPFGASSETQS
jgi:two-component sensor histidine kinase